MTIMTAALQMHADIQSWGEQWRPTRRCIRRQSRDSAKKVAPQEVDEMSTLCSIQIPIPFTSKDAKDGEKDSEPRSHLHTLTVFQS